MMSLNWAKNKVLHVENYDMVNALVSSVDPGATVAVQCPVQ